MPTTWVPPEGWTGPQPAAHRSFDTADGLVLMEGTQPADFPFIEGKVIIQCIHPVLSRQPISSFDDLMTYVETPLLRLIYISMAHVKSVQTAHIKIRLDGPLTDSENTFFNHQYITIVVKNELSNAFSSGE